MICLHVSPFSSEAMSSPVYGCVKGELSGPDVVGYRSLEFYYVAYYFLDHFFGSSGCRA